MSKFIKTYSNIPYNVAWLGTRELGYQVEAFDMDLLLSDSKGRKVLRLEIPEIFDPEGLCCDDEAFLNFTSFLETYAFELTIISKSNFDGAYRDAENKKAYQIDIAAGGKDEPSYVDAIEKLDKTVDAFTDKRNQFDAICSSYDPAGRTRVASLGAAFLPQEDVIVAQDIACGVPLDIETLRDMAHRQIRGETTKKYLTSRISRAPALG